MAIQKKMAAPAKIGPRPSQGVVNAPIARRPATSAAPAMAPRQDVRPAITTVPAPASKPAAVPAQIRAPILRNANPAVVAPTVKPVALSETEAEAKPARKLPDNKKFMKRFRSSLRDGISPVNDRDGTARYRNNQNADHLNPNAPRPQFSGNGQNADHLKNAGAGGGKAKAGKGAFGKKRPGKKPEIEDPPLPPTDGSGNTPSPPPAPPPAPLYMNADWSKVVGHYFPESSGMKDGGLVRGGGAATKGRGRGRMV